MNFKSTAISAALNPAQRRGFTLIEMLAAFALIAMLVLITIPAIDSLRSKSQTSQSLSNLRSIGAALLNYAATNGGTLPVQNWWSNNCAPAALSGGGSPNALGYLVAEGHFGSTALTGSAKPQVLRCPKNPRYFEQNGNWASYVYESPYSMPNGATDPNRNQVQYLSPNMAVAVDTTQVFSNNPPPHDGDKTAVLYGDGHVELRPWRGSNNKSLESHPRRFDLEKNLR